MPSDPTAPRWMRRVLLLAALYNLAWGAFVVVAPTAPFTWMGLEAPLYPEIWQCLGMVIGVYGVGYGLAAREPFRHWPIVLVGFMGKIFGPIGFVWAASRDRLPWEMGWTILTNDLVWWLPFGAILLGALRAHRANRAPPVLPVDVALSLYRDHDGRDLLSASEEKPLYLVFLRHFGCTFCREALSDLNGIRDWLKQSGSQLVLVHMSTEEEAANFFRKYELSDVTSISDPERVLYRAFALRRGRPSQLFGWAVWKRGWEAGVKGGHGIGWLRGDASQMPGAFMVWRGHVVAQFVHDSASDRPDYVALAEQGSEDMAIQEELEAAGVGYDFQDPLRELLQGATSSREA